MRNFILFVFVLAVAVAIGGKSFATVVPEENSQVDYFYVIGPKGDPRKGAEDHKQVLHIDVPAGSGENVEISIYDPNTGGDIDAKKNYINSWDTTTEITVSGGGGTLVKKEFGKSEADGEYLSLGSFSTTDGENIGAFYRFTLSVVATTGDDANLFKVKVSPDSARISSTNITFRLVPKKNAKMYFYPLIPNGVDQIVVENYDLDEDGGTSVLIDPADGKEYKISDSSSGKWRDTNVSLSGSGKRYLDYVVTKATQIDAHAGLRMTDSDGNPLSIYFSKQETPVVAAVVAVPPVTDKCNEFTFDATASFDPDNQALTFLWDFGDGSTSDLPVVKHAFENGGNYNVTLTVTDNSGLECNTAMTSQMVPVNSPPIAAFTAPGIACTNQTINFNASATTDDSPDISYLWNFGDGTTGEGEQITKVFEKGGTYNVVLAVNDNSGTSCDTDSVAHTITINTRPVAKAGDDIDLCLPYNSDYSIHFDGSGSYDDDGDQLNYKWDFGDGTSDTGAKINHVYQQGGEYVATLVVEDGSGSACSTDADTINIKINKAPVAEAGNTQVVCLGTEVTFDGSASISEEGETLTYDWDFGDGTTGSGMQVAHSYSQGGGYKAILTVNDGQSTKCSSSSDSVFVTVNTPPSAALSSVDTICTGDVVSFDASGTSDADGDNLTYSWDFGDGTTDENGPKVTHTYRKGGNYSVRLTVDDKKGTVCSQDMTAINVRVNTPPVADAGPNLVCCLDRVTDFDGSSSYDADGDQISYVWDFGDGSGGQGPQVSHAYSSPGTYMVTLTVNDNSGTRCDTATDSFTAVVNAKPTPIIKVR